MEARGMTIETMADINRQRELDGKGQAWSRDPYESWKWPKSAQAIWQATNWFRGKADSVEPGKKDRAFAEFIGRSRRTVQRGWQWLEEHMLVHRGDPKGRIDGQRVITVVADLASNERKPGAPEEQMANAPLPGPPGEPAPDVAQLAAMASLSGPERAFILLKEAQQRGCDIVRDASTRLLSFYPADMAKKLPQSLWKCIYAFREDVRSLIEASQPQLE
jgi:hypothetical protein